MFGSCFSTLAIILVSDLWMFNLIVLELTSYCISRPLTWRGKPIVYSSWKTRYEHTHARTHAHTHTNARTHAHTHFARTKKSWEKVVVGTGVGGGGGVVEKDPYTISGNDVLCWETDYRRLSGGWSISKAEDARESASTWNHVTC